MRLDEKQDNGKTLQRNSRKEQEISGQKRENASTVKRKEMVAREKNKKLIYLAFPSGNVTTVIIIIHFMEEMKTQITRHNIYNKIYKENTK